MENMLRGQIDGLKVSIRTLRESERLMIKANTLAEQIAQAQSNIGKFTEDLQEVKTKKETLKNQKGILLQDALEPLNQAITALLPRGEAVIVMDEDGLFIGWKDGVRLVPYLGLSGGEKILFDGALCAAMLKGSGDKIIVFESAEVDQGNLNGLISTITKVHPDVQVIISTWAKPDSFDIPEWWTVTKLN
uniref:Uncharacterized protein n=1 Tax=viral metagenome TaxID=1070528 RepID=A0A6M3IQ91_9ZZZZ